MTGIWITPKDEKEVIDYYKSKIMTISECADYFGYSNPTIIKILTNNGIPRYSKNSIYNPELYEDFFENIDSEEKAYYLGFIISDGNVYLPKDNHKLPMISISQSKGDKYILDYFLHIVRSNTVASYDGRGTYAAAIRSEKMFNDLSKYGIVPNKTFLSYLPKIDDKYMNHLIRGIFDGDGSISSKELNTRYLHDISICGTHQLMSDISDYVLSVLGIKSNVYDYKNRVLSEINYASHKNMYILGEWMYHNATIYLRRKHRAYVKFKLHYDYL